MLNLSEFQGRPKSLADYLPWAALVAPGIVLNKDGSLQRSCKYRGPDLESATPIELVSYTARINNALNRFGSGWALFFEAARRPSNEYPSSTFPDAASWLVDEERCNRFLEAGSHFESDFYLTLCWMPPADRAARVENLIIDDPGHAPKAFWGETLQTFTAQTDKALDLIQSLMPEVAWLSDDETLTFLHSTVSTKRHKVRAPSTPMHLDAVLTDCALIAGLSPKLGDESLRVVSVQGFPNATEPGLLSDLDQLGFSYRWVTRFIPMGKPDAEKVLTRYRRQWFAKRKSVMTILKETLENEPSALVNTDAENKAADADDALQALGAGHVGYGYLTTAIALSHVDPKIADEQARAVERVLNTHGFAVVNETMNVVDAWLGTHPGNAYANVRQPLIHTLNLAHMAPLSAVWAGPEENRHLKGPPLIMARSASNTPFRVTTHQGDVGHTMIVGPTGAGKSVLLSLIAMQFRKYQGGRAFIFDKGRSARVAVLCMGGHEYDLSPKGGRSFQPLKSISIPAEQTFATTWLLGLLEQEGVEITPETREAVWETLLNLADAPERQRTLTGFCALLQSSKLRQALHPYTLDGPYGALLDASFDDLTQSDLALFEMEELMQDKRLAAPVLSYLFHRLEARFDGTPTLLILDEAWVFLDHPMFAERLREWLKTLRKKNVSVIFATQSLADISRNAIASTLIESCPTRIFLPNARAQEPGQAETYEAFGLSTRQIEIIGRASPKRDYYLQCPAGNRLFDLELGPIALSFCASGSKSDQNAINRIVKDNASGPAFAARWLEHKGLEWASNLILEASEGGTLCAAE